MESGQIQIQADTIAKLAEKLGVPADKLQESVDGYNAAYEAGKDVKFDVPRPFCRGLHGENDSMKVDSSSAACHRAYTRSANLYPTRHTVSRYFGCEGLSSIFSRILRMNTVMLLSSTLLSRPQMCS